MIESEVKDMMSNKRSTLIIAIEACATFLCTLFITAPALAQQPNGAGTRGQVSRVRARTAFPWPLMAAPASLTPAAGSSLPVVGGGTLGRLTKWTGFTGTNSVIGDTTIFEDKFGNVGIGTDTPTSKLTVNGTIQASGGSSVLHDTTLTGSGTNASPLGVAVPLTLEGPGFGSAIIQAINTSDDGPGLSGVGGDSNQAFSFGGAGVEGHGGNNISTGVGGLGVIAFGGFGGAGGGGVYGEGGISTTGSGGDGLSGKGGTGFGAGHSGGNGITAFAGRGANGAIDGLAGKFNGDVQVTGNLSKGGGSFKIDHPLDPENKYLYHSFVESPDMMNIYNGNTVTDANGNAVVELPGYFDALNRDFRYQLTVIGTFAQAIVAEKIRDNRFRIKTSTANVEVSWQVTGIRQDAYANNHRIPVEEAKPEAERGTYLHPDSFDQPEEKNVLFVQHPEVIERMKETRAKQQKARKN